MNSVDWRDMGCIKYMKVSPHTAPPSGACCSSKGPIRINAPLDVLACQSHVKSSQNTSFATLVVAIKASKQ
jgi:hypothetical protein